MPASAEDLLDGDIGSGLKVSKDVALADMDPEDISDLAESESQASTTLRGESAAAELVVSIESAYESWHAAMPSRGPWSAGIVQKLCDVDALDIVDQHIFDQVYGLIRWGHRRAWRPAAAAGYNGCIQTHPASNRVLLRLCGGAAKGESSGVNRKVSVALAAGASRRSPWCRASGCWTR